MEPPTQANAAAYLASLYRSTLTVTGVFPGVYQYSVSNRATTTPSTASFNIEGTVECQCSKIIFAVHDEQHYKCGLAVPGLVRHFGVWE
jgi:hypothetical protein